MQIHRIDSLEDPRLEPYRTLRRPMDHRRQNIFVAEGSLVVQRLLESNLPVLSLLLTQEWLERVEPLLQSRSGSVDVCVVPKQAIEQTIGYSCHQGIKAVGQIPALPTLETVLQSSPRPRLFVAVDALSNAENLGTLVRNCTAFGVQALFVGETCSSPYLTRAVRCSMGTIFKLPVVEVAGLRTPEVWDRREPLELPLTRPADTLSPSDGERDGVRGRTSILPGSHRQAGGLACPSLAQTLRDLRGHGVRCVAAHPHEDKRRLSQSDLRHDCCLVFGSEGYGISAPVLEACDEAAAIPMHTEVDSLNVGCASAAFLYEANRQRGKA